MWEQHCYDSVLAGKAASAEDHRLAVNTANVMGWETFREFHDCYLHTDILALTDVMESYRDSFRAQSGLDTSSPTSRPEWRPCAPAPSAGSC